MRAEIEYNFVCIVEVLVRGPGADKKWPLRGYLLFKKEL
jgi:hypothetical protein